MKALDGRNSHEVPKIIDLPSFLTIGKWIAKDTDGNTRYIYCLQLDGELVPCVSGPAYEKKL